MGGHANLCHLKARPSHFTGVLISRTAFAVASVNCGLRKLQPLNIDTITLSLSKKEAMSAVYQPTFSNYNTVWVLHSSGLRQWHLSSASQSSVLFQLLKKSQAAQTRLPLPILPQNQQVVRRTGYQTSLLEADKHLTEAQKEQLEHQKGRYNKFIKKESSDRMTGWLSPLSSCVRVIDFATCQNVLTSCTVTVGCGHQWLIKEKIDERIQWK